MRSRDSPQVTKLDKRSALETSGGSVISMCVGWVIGAETRRTLSIRAERAQGMDVVTYDTLPSQFSGIGMAPTNVLS